MRQRFPSCRFAGPPFPGRAGARPRAQRYAGPASRLRGHSRASWRSPSRVTRCRTSRHGYAKDQWVIACSSGGDALPDCKARPESRAAGMRLRCSAGYRGDDVVHHPDNKVAVVALAHDPDDGLGPGRADDEPAAVAEALAGRLDDVDHRLLLEGLALLVAHVLENLRQRLETVTDLADRLVEAFDHREKLQDGDEAVASRRVVGHDDVARLLAAEVVAVLPHVLEHIAVADCGADELQAEAAEVALEAE